MNGASYAKFQLEQAFGLLNATADGMTDEQYNHNPNGTSNPCAKNHVHSLTAVDFFLINKAAGKDMLWPAFAAQHGLPANSLEIWGYDGTIPLAAIKEFGATIQKAALDYVGTLTDADLDRSVDTQFFGTQTVAFLIQLAAMHAVGHTGDIAAVKGFQGLKGLPF